ncbi:MAG TPA: hypothetical protein PLP26_11205 [Ilumatobacteraceae bacterium]|nr:hypothetical protein [Ilumatobacteraceae bacterium]
MADARRSGVIVACELADLGADMLATRLRRQHPELSDAEVEARVRAWWLDRRGAPNGDSAGVVRPIPQAWL